MLKVWLPLDGDLKNLGCSDVTVTNNGATVDNNGKIGKCYSFTSGKYLRSAIPTNLKTKEISYTCWIYVTSWNNSWDAFMSIANGTGWTTSRATLCRNNTASTLTWNIADGNTSVRVSSITAINLNTWYHVACTYDGANLKIYINGNLDNSTPSTLSIIYAGTFNIGGWSGNNYPINGKLNDVRIYDHCLSAAEVHEIAMGLVLHYKLNNNLNIGNNLLPNSLEMNLGTANASTGTWRLAGISNMSRARVAIADTPEGSGYGFQNSGIQTANDGSCYGIDNFPLEPNTVYIISMWARIIEGTEGYAGFSIYSSTPINGWSKIERNYYLTQLSPQGEWIKCYMTFMTNTSMTRNIYIGITTGDTSVTTQMCNVHIEKGIIQDNIIQDSSGYGHNGTIVGNTSINSSTPRFQNSFKLLADGITNYQYSGAAYIVSEFGLTTPKQMTIAFWAYPENGYGGSANHASFCTTSSTYPTDYNTTAFNHRDGSFDINYSSTASNAIRLTFPYSLGAWNHYTITYDGQTAKAYKNGVLTNSTAFSSAHDLMSFTKIFIGLSAAGGAYRKTIGSYSDFRIYCTPLLDNDIKMLYNVGMKVDNLGEVHTFEFDEINSNPKLFKTGIFKNQFFIEDGYEFNQGKGWSFTAAGTQNSCAGNVIADFSNIATLKQSITLQIECDVNWSNIKVGTESRAGGWFQGSNRKLDGTWKWEGANYAHPGTNLTSLFKANANGSTHIKVQKTIPASWFDTYNGSNISFRTDYTTGTITLSNLKVTLVPEKFKINSVYIASNNFIEI